MSRGIEFAKRGDFLTSNGKDAFDIDPYGAFKKKNEPGRDKTTRIRDVYGTIPYSKSSNPYDDTDWTTVAEEEETRNAAKRDGVNYKNSYDPKTNRNTRINGGEFDCLQFIKDCLGFPRDGRGGGGDGDSVTLEDIRNFLDSHSDIKDMLMKQECPLNPSETMKSDVKEVMEMMEKYGPVTMNELYPKGGRKRRSKRTKRRKGKSKRRYSKRR